MSPIGRIFTVLNLILAAAFLGWAANALSSVENYKEQLADAQKQHADELAAKDTEISTLNTDKGKHQDDARKFREERDNVTGERDSLQTQIDEQKRRQRQPGDAVTAIQASLSGYKDTIDSLTSQKDAAVQAHHEAQNERDDATQSAQAAEMARRDAEEASQNAALRIADLEGQLTSAQTELESLQTRFDTLVEVTNVDPANFTTLPPIDAAVLEVRLDLSPGLVMVNAGKNKNVRPGYTFEIYRGSQYKGQVRIENVQDNVSSGVIVRAVPGTTMVQGDLAATQL